MQVTREDLNPCTVKLTVECAPEEVKSGFDKAYKQIAKQIRVPGFRPGTAPKAVLDQMVDPEEVQGRAADQIVRDTLRKAVEQEKLNVHDTPSVQLKLIDKDAGKLEYEAKIPLPPVVELGEYRGLVVDRPKVEVTDEEVEHQLGELQKRTGTRQEVTDRGIIAGDMALLNIKIESDEGEGRNFLTKAGETFPALDEAILGMNVEQMKRVELTFPENFQEADWAGKKLEVKVTVRSVNTIKSPDLDDNFAQSLKNEFGDLQSANLDELKEKVRERLTMAKTAMAAEYVDERIQEELLKTSKVEVPDTMWENVAQQRLEDLREEAQRAGSSLEKYAEENGMTVEQLVQEWSHEAKMHVMRAVVTNEIFRREGMQLTNSDLQGALFMMAREYRVHPDTILEAMKKNKNFQELQIRGTFRKVLDFLQENANIQEVDFSTPQEPTVAAAAPKKTKSKSKAKAEADAE